MKYRKVFILICLMLYIVAMAAFLHMPSQNEENKTNQVLTVWGWDETIPDAFDQYQLSHPKASMNYVYVEKNEYLNKLKLSLALQEPLPDICILENEMLDDFIHSDLFEDLSKQPYSLKESEILENRYAEVRTQDDGIWGVPAIPGSSGVAYNRSLALEFLNTDDPGQVAVVFNSWADVISKGQRFVEEHEGKAMFASLEDAAVMVYGQSIEPYIKNQQLLEPYKFMNYFSILAAMRDAKLVKDYQQYSPQWLNSFKYDEIFFYPCPLWIINLGVFDSEQSWGYTVPPSGSYQWGGTIWAIPKSSVNKAMAWDFMKTVLLTPAGAMYNKNKENGTFISYRKAYETAGYRDLILENFDNQNIGKLYFNQILPSMADYQQGENANVIRDVYLEVVRAMSQVKEMDASTAYQLFIQRLKDRLPKLEVIQ
ncbi:ABC transporter substrate-binding protein [Dielma fastidiosa]|uniref:ABC transporter substrate-binding protein n=1 Tax=Dielma fastidiosa TaxID=1034346 RepID=UPI0015FE298C|nr:ABC transporter substrate-binding protein [Dielma fastidiosa]